jgi:ELWxxDGT repeat protein
VLVRGGLGFAVNTLTVVGDRLFFVSVSTDTGRELWTSDGTTEGTMLVEDLNPGPAGADPLHLTAARGRLFFFPTTPSLGREPWVSDGTARGTRPVRDINPGPADGIASLPFPTPMGRSLFFVASTPDTGLELWKTDGTSRGTVLVKDIGPGPGGSFPQELQASEGVLYFRADGDLDGFSGIWKSDGTARGTVRVFERPDFFSSLELMLSVDGKLLFRADDRIHGVEPWVSDGTERGTRILRDIALGEESSSPLAFTHVGSRVFFIANDGFTGMEPWVVPVSSLGRECREPSLSAEAEAQKDSRQRCSR